MSRPERRHRQFEPKNIKRSFLGSGLLHVLALGVLLSLPVVLYRQLERRKPPQVEFSFTQDLSAQMDLLPEPVPEVEVVPPEDFEARLKEAEEEPPVEVEDWSREPSPLSKWPLEQHWVNNPRAFEKFVTKPKATAVDLPPTESKPKPTPIPTPSQVDQPKPRPAPDPPPASNTQKRPDPIPDPTASPDPTYPWQALRRRLQGVAQILVEVDSKGKVVTARVAQTSGHGILDRAALDAVKKWKFLPALKDGKPVPGAALIPVNFHFKANSSS